MKYTLEIDLGLPRERVIELFDNPENMPKWQPDLVSFEPESGEPGQVGARSRLRYKMGKREIDMIETITVRNLPDEFSGTYEANNVWNVVRNRFIETGPESTRWVLDTEFACRGWMRLMAWFMPGAFKKESRRMMEQFKAFAETHAIGG